MKKVTLFIVHYFTDYFESVLHAYMACSYTEEDIEALDAIRLFHTA